MDEHDPLLLGTQLEASFSGRHRSEYGVHFTSREDIKRVVTPTIVDPIRKDWEACGGVYALHKLRTALILDPACGSGNFLSVTYDLLMELEREILSSVPDPPLPLSLPKMIGLEKDPKTAEIARQVMRATLARWGHDDTRVDIRCQDAILAWNDVHTSESLVWDMRSYKRDPETNRLMPDLENGLVHDQQYVNPRQPDWPTADFIVGNPPFLGNKAMRKHLGDGYVEALYSVWPKELRCADLSMYWWHRAASLTLSGCVRRFGMITTSSISLETNRRVVAPFLEAGLNLPYVATMFPWSGLADVNVTLTVGSTDGEITKHVDQHGRVTNTCGVHPNLTPVEGTDVTIAKPLQSNIGWCHQGFNLCGKGFIVPYTDSPVVFPYISARDLLYGKTQQYTIDLHGFTEDQVRHQHPDIYEHVRKTVKPLRDHDKDAPVREKWWLYSRSGYSLRLKISQLSHVILTVETSKHRVFVRRPTQPRTVFDHKISIICSDESWVFGVLSSKVQRLWSLATCGWITGGMTPRWRIGACFEAFPFPDPTQEVKDQIGQAAMEIQTYRECSPHNLTALYNLLESGDPSVYDLSILHERLDRVVLSAYGWSNAKDADIVGLVADLNAERRAEEAAGQIRQVFSLTNATACASSPLNHQQT